VAPEGVKLFGDAVGLFLGAGLEVVGPPRIVPNKRTKCSMQEVRRSG
jgi:hypothetical protein